ncbi:MAG TPA: TetR family transcriptional regulator [Gaiellaceae bacterium]
MREAAARQTREAIVAAAAEAFAVRGWSATTMREIAGAAGVSVKTVEAVYRTKAALLEVAVDFAIRGDVEPVQMPQREAVRRMEDAPDAAAMLRLHAAHLRSVNGRSAGIARTVEQAAEADEAVARLWRRMNENRRFAVSWAAKTLLAKPGRRRGLRRADVDTAFWVALDWGTYRTLTEHAGLTPAGFERWLVAYYRAQFLPL